MKKYIEKYGKELVRKALRSKQAYTTKYKKTSRRDSERFYVTRGLRKAGLRSICFEIYSLGKYSSIYVYVQKIGTTYTVTDCGYSVARYLENNLSTEKNIILSEIKFKNVPSNKLVKAICECASKSYKLITTGK